MTRTVPPVLAALVAAQALALSATGPAQGSDACAAAPVRPPCMGVARDTAREVASDGVVTPSPRQAWATPGFDRDGNALDRRGRILAVPGSAGRPAEVFTAD